RLHPRGGGVRVDQGRRQLRGGGGRRLQVEPVRLDGTERGFRRGAVQHGRIRGDDHPLPPEEEDRLLRDPDVPALHHDRHPVPGVLLAQQGVRARQDRL
ncbi:hypothetical protein CRUP_023081, partial [Coryphaenoides rupestris]